ncbi:hypothetical protein IFM89_033643 [Coptis chinensis]|uniref:Uncharacterized protein n=1 Tax=Coptis chinensis TaxID=261450 RepID=A0A835HNR3_9MAGN|nr:hypothetical protein IFM89_033643 [Coptis chinensis]
MPIEIGSYDLYMPLQALKNDLCRSIQDISCGYYSAAPRHSQSTWFGRFQTFSVVTTLGSNEVRGIPDDIASNATISLPETNLKPWDEEFGSFKQGFSSYCKLDEEAATRLI